jgi:predicted ATPase
MISRVEALNYRCLRYVDQPLGPFHVLVGPNASGKTTFLDVVAFLGRLVSDGLDAAIEERTQSFQDLVWGREGDRFELAIEAKIPDDRTRLVQNGGFGTLRYETAIGIHADTGDVSIIEERVHLKRSLGDKGYFKKPFDPKSVQRELFPNPPAPPPTIFMGKRATNNCRIVINKVPQGQDHFLSEVYQDTGTGWVPSFKLGPRKSALGNLPEDESKFPAATWLKGLLSEGIQQIMLNSMLIRKASPPQRISGFKPDGSNLPWVIHRLKTHRPERHAEWIEHLRTALPDIEDIRTVEREDDKHRYLIIRYRGGLEVPSWMASDGTLRLLALTLVAYLDKFQGVYLFEEPENGIHPLAVETMFQSLSCVDEAQVLLATHSPIILSIADADSVLCFAKNEEGATDIVLGGEHPSLRDWRGETNLGTLFASGVLG